MKKLNVFNRVVWLMIPLLTIFTTNALGTEVTFNANSDLGDVTSNGECSGDDVTKSGITIQSSNGPMGNGENYRVYSGGTLTISGATITSVVVTCTATGNSSYGPKKLSGSGYTGSNQYTGTWTGSSTTVTLTAGAQVRMTSIVVTYSGGGGGCTAGEASSISVGDVILIYYPSGSKEFGGYTENNGSYYGSAHAYTTTPDGYFPFTVEAGSASGYFSFKNGSTYLAMSGNDNNRLVGSATKNDASSWSVSINGSKEATITNKSYTTKVIKYNTSSPRFSSYASSTGSTAWPHIYIYCGDIKYYVTYEGNGNTSGSVPTDATGYSSGATVTVKGNTGSLAKTGYTFGGWNTNAGGTGTNYAAGSGTFSISSNTTLYAKWTANTISLTLNKNNSDASGSANGSASVKYDATSLTSISHATRTGYDIEGYYAEVGCSNKVLSNTGALVNCSGYVSSGKWIRTTTPTTLYAKWTVKTTTVSFNQNSGTGGQTSNLTATYGLAMPAISGTPTRDHYTFDGYYDGSGGTGTKYYNSDGSSARNWDKENATWTLYAKWTAEKYTVTWSVDGNISTISPTTNVTYNTTTTAPTVSPSPCGTFMGWTSNSNWSSDSAPGDLFNGTTPTITGDITYYAVFADEEL